MPSLLGLIAEREATTTATADLLRAQIAKLSAELALAETELTELAVTRRTLQRLTGQAEAAVPVDATIAGTAYQQILAVFATAPSGMRAKDTEGIRASSSASSPARSS